MNYFVDHIYVDNILSFNDIYIKLDKLTVLIGPNASGKSNFIKVLRFLKYIPSGMGINAICKDILKLDTIESFFNNPNKKALIRIFFNINNKEYHYEIDFNSDGTILNEFVQEGSEILLQYNNKSSRRRPLKKDEITIKYKLENLDWGVIISNKSYPALPQLEKNAHPDIFKIKEIIKNIVTYSFIPENVRTISDISYMDMLSYDGSNLAQVLHTLLTYNRKIFLEIENIMKLLIPEIEEINTPPVKEEQMKGKSQVYLAIREKGIKDPLKFANVSDGTLRILAFVTALYLQNSLIAFEEPENCVHPYLYETLIDLYIKSPPQVIITTHSPYFLNKVKTEYIRLFTKKDAKTYVNEIKNIQETKALLEEGISLGEIWYSGRLENNKIK